MFQYTFGRRLQEKYQQQVIGDLISYQSNTVMPKTFPEILKFNTQIKVADAKSLNNILLFSPDSNQSKSKKRIQIVLEAIFNKNYYLEYNRAWRDPESLLKYSYYDGYWQSWRYLIGIEEKLKKEFQLKGEISKKSLGAITEYSNINSVMVGIRRGDYLLKKRHYGVFTSEYYQHCMDYIVKKINDPVFIVFSNDIEWVREHMDFKDYKVIYRTEELQDSDIEELMVMAACRHFIIVNSTYQWWGAWLSKNPYKIVMAPNNWFADNKPIDIVPPEWIRV